MESSFLEDLLKREVDQNQVNALVGSLENQLTTPRSTPTPSAVIKSTSAPKKTLISSNTPPPNSLSTGANGNREIVIPTSALQNGQINTKPIKSVAQPTFQATIAQSVPQQIRTSANNMPAPNSASPQISIAPKISNTVNIAPRVGTNIMITPRQAQLLMAQRTILNNGGIIAGMAGNIPVVPRLPGAPIAIPPVMNTQIHNIRTLSAATGGINPRIRMNPTISAASLTQIKSNNPVPGQVNYRFRAANPGNGVSTTNCNTNNSQNNTNITMMKESVKRLKEFFQNLINLACGPNQPPEIGKIVKDLVHNLMQCRVTEEEFIEKLQKTLKSDPQPNLVHFLKKTLPHLRESIKKQQLMQNKQQQEQKPRLPTKPLSTLLAGQQRGMSPQQLILGKNLTPQEQQMLQKQLIQQGRIVIASSGQPTPGVRTVMNQANHLVANNQVIRQIQTPMSAVGSREKPRNTHYSSAIGADDDINDVTCMAGVNLMEESQKILASGVDFISSQTRNVKDTPLIMPDQMKSKVQLLAKKHGMTEVTSEFYMLLSHAVENRIRNLLERLTVCCLHRNDPHKDEVKYERISDVRGQLCVFEDIDEVERKHRESREREMLMRVAKSRSKAEDPEQARLKEKAKQLQQEEEEVNRKRAANRTALEAIGGPRKKRKLDEALESLQNSPKSQTPSQAPSSTSSNAPCAARQRRITLSDVQFVLESEKDTCKSVILYRSFLR